LSYLSFDWYRPPTSISDDLDAIGAALPSGISAALNMASQRLTLPPIGRGATRERFQTLAEVAAIDLSLGRIFEGHGDALEILRTAGLEARSGSYGVWAADTPALAATESGGVWLLDGTKGYCSGAPFLDHALVTAQAGDRSRLFEIDLGRQFHLVADSWPSVGMAASQSFTIELEDAPAVRCVGEPDYYTQRPGFWQGSLNVPACWFGSALGLARGVLNRLGCDTSPHTWAAFGLLSSEIESISAVLNAATEATDLDPLDKSGLGKQRAFSVRHLVYQSVSRVIELAGEIGGTGGFTHDAEQSRRLADLPIYLRQHHPGRDSEALGRMSFARYSGG